MMEVFFFLLKVQGEVYLFFKYFYKCGEYENEMLFIFENVMIIK